MSTATQVQCVLPPYSVLCVSFCRGALKRDHIFLVPNRLLVLNKIHSTFKFQSKHYHKRCILPNRKLANPLRTYNTRNFVLWRSQENVCAHIWIGLCVREHAISTLIAQNTNTFTDMKQQ